MEHKCIYCGKTDNLSESDIIPDALTNARIINKNVCEIEHNNRFSDMFESKVIKSLAFITNELDIKSRKGKKYASYDATLIIDGVEYNVSLHGDNNIFDGRVLKSVDNTQMISSYDKIVSIAGDESKVHTLDVNKIEIEKRIQIKNEIFFDSSMYRMISKIAFEWYCSKNDVVGYHKDFENIIRFITTGEGNNPVSIIQQEEIYKFFSEQFNLGSHTLFAFEASSGEINVIVSLFGLIIYRVEISPQRPTFCTKNFLFTELCIDSTRHEIIHESFDSANKFFIKTLNSSKFYPAANIGGIQIMSHISIDNVKNITLYPFVLNMVPYFDSNRDDIISPNDKIISILLQQINIITQSSTLQKKSIKRFVNERFPEGHAPIQFNPYSNDKKSIVLFYVVYLIGMSELEKLDDKSFQRLLKDKLATIQTYTGQEMVVTDEVAQKIKSQMMETANYSEILERGATIIKQWNN